MQIAWSFLAHADRNRVFDYIDAENPRAAIAVDMAIAQQVQQLVAFPLSGRAGRIEATRELPVTGLPYLIVYRLMEDKILILRLLHGAQQWP